MSPPLEVDRIRDHILRAEQLAATRDVAPLTHLQRILRQLLLQALEAYRADGRFPINRDFEVMTPYFVDATGTRCAMAHLLELGGESALVAKIARERNNAYVRELANEAQLIAWLEAAGLTVEEAAAIQPGYCGQVADCICGGDFSHIDYPVPALGVLEAVIEAGGMARIERTYGDSLGYAVGDTFAVQNTSAAAGTRVLAPITEAMGPYSVVVLESSQLYECRSQAVGDAPGISAADFAQAVTAGDCEAALAAMDPVWRMDTCQGVPPDDEPDPESDPDGGCNAGAADSLGVGILLALVASFVRRPGRTT